MWMLFGVLAPELVVYIAYTQYSKAKWLSKELTQFLEDPVC
jgi:hypothetical protein